MSENITITVKAGSEKVVKSFTAAETVRFDLTIAAGEEHGVEYQIPGLPSPKFITVMVEGYDPAQDDPIEVYVDLITNYPIACTPVAVLTANTTSGFSVAGAGTAPIGLFFNNPQTVPVTVHVVAGE